MGQIETAEILKKHYPDWIDYKKLMELTGCTKDNAITSLRKLRKRTECEVKVIQGEKGFITEYRMKI